MRVRGEYVRKGELQERGREEGQSGSSGRVATAYAMGRRVHKTKRGMHMTIIDAVSHVTQLGNAGSDGNGIRIYVHAIKQN